MLNIGRCRAVSFTCDKHSDNGIFRTDNYQFSSVFYFPFRHLVSLLNKDVWNK